MALPRGLGEGAADLVGKISDPIAHRLSAVKEELGSKEGLKNIAFEASGRDPTAALSVGIALGMTGLAVGLGAKGLGAIFRGIKNMIGGKKPEIGPEISMENSERQTDELSGLTEIMTEFRQQTEDQLSELINIGKEHFKLSEGILTNAARERLEKARQRAIDEENQLEANRLSQDQIDLLRDGFPAQDSAGEKEKGKGLMGLMFDKILTGLGISGGFSLGTFLFKGRLGSIATVGKNFISSISGMLGRLVGGIASAIPRLIPQILKTAFRAFSGVMIVSGLVNGILNAFENIKNADSIKEAFFGMIDGIIGGMGETFGKLFGLDFDPKEFHEKMNSLRESFGNMLGAFGNLADKKVFSKIRVWGDDTIKALKDANFIDTLKSGLLDLFTNLWKAVATPIAELIGMIPGLGGISESLLKTTLSPEERVLTEHREQKEAAQKSIADISKKRAALSERKTGIFFTEQDKQAKLAELNAQYDISLNEFHNLERMEKASAIKATPIFGPEAPKEKLADIKQKSMEMSMTAPAPVIVNSPNVTTSSNVQTVNNALSLPVNPRNHESTVDRAFSSEFH